MGRKGDFMNVLFYFTLKIFASLRLCAFALIFFVVSNAQTLAPNAPGKDAQWATAGKQGVGTSATLESKVWFTLAQGVMTEVYYPDVTVANVHLLQFVVVNPKTKKVETEQDDAIHQIKVLRPDSLTFQQINTAKSGEWKITKTYTTDVKRNTVLFDVEFEQKNPELSLYVHFDPSIGNSGMQDSGYTGTDFLLADEKEKSVSLSFTSKLEEETAGFYRSDSDGLEQLKQFGKITNRYKKAENGNVVLTAKIKTPRKFTAILSFASDFKKSFIKIDSSNIAVLQGEKSKSKGFQKCLIEYEKGWADYIKTIRKVEPKYQAQFNMAAMQLKAHEDKTVRGANIASLTVPWGGGDNANENNIGGYHLIWSRDLYQVATAFMALGDTAAANRALEFLFKVQQKPDGSFPQNSFLDGKPFWGSLQLDEVAFPLILAYQLKRFDKATYENHVKKAADFLVKTGPKTPQERWEEKSGYSPSTIAAEIAGLVCAAHIAKLNGDEASATIYLATADDWARKVEMWTATTNGKYGDGNYYIRLTENGKPDAKEPTVLNNNAGTFIENEIIDAGFLELVRLGIKSPDDPLIAKSLKVVDQVIKVNTPNGEGFYRYNHDGYGEMDDGRRWNWDGKYTGKGRLWALLSGERGQYEIALHRFFYPNQTPVLENGIYLIREEADTLKKREYLLDLNSAKFRLDAMLAFANEGLMIPEQIWDQADVPKNIDKQFVPELKFGEGTGSATPLAWSMAQFIRLAVNLQEGKNLDTPDIVYNRYVLGKKDTTQSNITSPLIMDCEIHPFTTCSNEILEKGKKLACFFYPPNAQKVDIAGDFTEWKPKNILINNRAENCLEFAPTARVEYKLIVDGKWITDPLNPNKIDNGVGGENSFFTMPDYQPTIWDKGETPQLETIEIESKIYGKRKVQVYVPKSEPSAVADGLTRTSENKNLNGSKQKLKPPATADGSDLLTLYLQDGTDYVNRAKAVQIQRNLVKAGKVKPFIMVFLDPKDRMKEYWASDDYAKFVAMEVVPAIDAKYNTLKNRDGRAIIGASLGGITSVWVGLKYPETFSKIGGQSSSFWVDNERVVKELEKLDANKTKFKFYFDDGTLEGVEDTRRVNVMLRGKGYSVTYLEGETGHNWTSWRDRLENAFVAFMN